MMITKETLIQQWHNYASCGAKAMIQPALRAGMPSDITEKLENWEFYFNENDFPLEAWITTQNEGLCITAVNTMFSVAKVDLTQEYKTVKKTYLATTPQSGRIVMQEVWESIPDDLCENLSISRPLGVYFDKFEESVHE